MSWCMSLVASLSPQRRGGGRSSSCGAFWGQRWLLRTSATVCGLLCGSGCTHCATRFTAASRCALVRSALRKLCSRIFCISTPFQKIRRSHSWMSSMLSSMLSMPVMKEDPIWLRMQQFCFPMKSVELRNFLLASLHSCLRFSWARDRFA